MVMIMFQSKQGNTETDEYKKFAKEIEPVLEKASSRLKAEERDERRRKAEVFLIQRA